MNLSSYNVTGRNYYFVRTERGAFFDTFVQKGYIGLLWNEISKSMLSSLDINNQDLRRLLERTHAVQLSRQNEVSQARTISTIINKLITFRDLKKGDIVLIPSAGTFNIAFGVIDDDEVYSQLDENPCQKRRKVKWINQVTYRRLDAKFAYIAKSYHAISEIDQQYADVINAYMFKSYIDDTHGAINLKIDKEGPIHYRDVNTVIQGIISIANKYNEKNGIEGNYDDLEILVNLQSPGFLTLKSLEIAGKGLIFALALITLGCTQQRSREEDSQLEQIKSDYSIDTDEYNETIETLDSLRYQP
ncbi:MAG: hypothetical protein QE487_05460 [Fluviicola sp.]|nr:hypothetical protein [Fluviicola sp.]